jgi:hypothetical protein
MSPSPNRALVVPPVIDACLLPARGLRFQIESSKIGRRLLGPRRRKLFRPTTNGPSAAEPPPNQVTELSKPRITPIDTDQTRWSYPVKVGFLICAIGGIRGCPEKKCIGPAWPASVIEEPARRQATCSGIVIGDRPFLSGLGSSLGALGVKFRDLWLRRQPRQVDLGLSAVPSA